MTMGGNEITPDQMLVQRAVIRPFRRCVTLHAVPALGLALFRAGGEIGEPRSNVGRCRPRSEGRA